MITVKCCKCGRMLEGSFETRVDSDVAAVKAGWSAEGKQDNRDHRCPSCIGKVSERRGCYVTIDREESGGTDRLRS